MEDPRTQALAVIRAHAQARPHAVLFDEPAKQLFDVPSAKLYPLEVAELARVEQRNDKDTKAPYVLLVFTDGRQVALTDAGIGFAPEFRNTGALQLPQVVCFRDFLGLLNRLKHDLYGHADREPTRDTVSLLMMCIAIVDGARLAGFDVAREEKELDTHLQELERRAPKVPTT